jgi:hypothetical protein
MTCRYRPSPDQYTFAFITDYVDEANSAAGSSVATARDNRAMFIPFPLARRRVLVLKLAAEMQAARTAELAEKALQGRAARLGRALRRKRIAEDVIRDELRALEIAVRAEVWRVPSAKPRWAR